LSVRTQSFVAGHRRCAGRVGDGRSAASGQQALDHRQWRQRAPTPSISPAEIVGRYKQDRPAWAAIALTTDTSALTGDRQ